VHQKQRFSRARMIQKSQSDSVGFNKLLHKIDSLWVSIDTHN
jgi:hypothetical protein